MVFVQDCFKNVKLGRYVAAVYMRYAPQESDDSKATSGRKKYVYTCNELRQLGIEIDPQFLKKKKVPFVFVFVHIYLLLLVVLCYIHFCSLLFSSLL
jgi:hypothetical protein